MLPWANPCEAVSTLPSQAGLRPVCKKRVQGPRPGRLGQQPGTTSPPLPSHPEASAQRSRAGERGCGCGLCADSLRAEGGGRRQGGGAGSGGPTFHSSKVHPRSRDESQARALGFPQVRGCLAPDYAGARSGVAWQGAAALRLPVWPGGQGWASSCVAGASRARRCSCWAYSSQVRAGERGSGGAGRGAPAAPPHRPAREGSRLSRKEPEFSSGA